MSAEDGWTRRTLTRTRQTARVRLSAEPCPLHAAMTCMRLTADHPGRAAGLPLVYNEAKIAAYWRNKPGELARRWAKFARISGSLRSQLRSTCWCPACGTDNLRMWAMTPVLLHATRVP